MKFNCLIITILLFTSSHISAKDKSFGNATVLEVTSIYDGDTFRANIEGFPAVIGEHMSIRINGIDTPELRGKCDKEKQLARLAKQFAVERLRAANSVVLKNIKRGKYFRLIADVYVDGVSLGEQLIKQGHAVKYIGKAKQVWC
jgi:endonuclease YncB( thermonuclease family)